MSTRHLIAAAALAAMATGVVAQQDTTRMDRSSPSWDSRSDMRGSSGIQAGTSDESQEYSVTTEAGPTVQPRSDSSLSRSEVQQEGSRAMHSGESNARYQELYGGD